MTISAERMQAIMVDVDLDRGIESSPNAPFTLEELAFRDRVAAELALAKHRGQRLGFTPEIPG